MYNLLKFKFNDYYKKLLTSYVYKNFKWVPFIGLDFQSRAAVNQIPMKCRHWI